MCLKKTVPVFLQAMMTKTIITKTSAAISKMLRATETIITGRMLPLDSFGDWVAECMDNFCQNFCLEYIDDNLASIH